MTSFDPATLAMNSKTAKSVEDAVSGNPNAWILEPKFDGIRLLVNVTETGVRMYARSGKSKTGKLPAIDAELFAALPAGTWLDCEAVDFNADGTQNWGGAQSVLGSDVAKAAARSGNMRLVVFDLIAHGGLDARSLPLSQRRTLLDEIFAAAIDAGVAFARVTLSPWLPATDEWHQANLELGFEGSMCKRIDAPYASGKRSPCSLKLKATDTVDAVITGFSPATPGSWIDQGGMVGAIEFTHYEDGREIEGKCSGMTSAERRWISDNQVALTGAVIEVSYMTRMPDSGKLRHPQYKRIRTDKTAEECQA